MKKEFKNFEIEKILSVLNGGNSFLANEAIKLPKEARQAIRINNKTLTERNNIYREGKQEIADKYVSSGRAVKSDDGSTITPLKEYSEEFKTELIELAMVNNSLELEPISKVVVDYICDFDISMPEEDVLLMFVDEE